MQKLRAVRATWTAEDAGWARSVDGVAEHTPSTETARTGRRRLLGAELGDGSMVALPEAREVGWAVDLAREAQRLGACGTGRCLLWTGEDWKGALMGCGARLCPVCLRARGGRRVARWLPALELAAQEGAGVYHVTLTQRADVAPGALVLPHERRRWLGDSGPGVVLPACGGESALAAHDRLRDAFTDVRDNRSTRELWRWALGGYLYGVEWTQRPSGARGATLPRWHCHAHVLVVAERPWPRGTWPRLVQSWCARADAVSRAQHCRTVAVDGVARALRETLKYPFKIPDMTTAGLCEVTGGLKGVRSHHAGGAFHASSKRSKGAPYARWLDARVDPPSWRRLMWRRWGSHSELDWELYTGQQRTGPAQWRMHGHKVWETEADRYYSLLQQAGEYEVAADEVYLDGECST